MNLNTLQELDKAFAKICTSGLDIHTFVCISVCDVGSIMNTQNLSSVANDTIKQHSIIGGVGSLVYIYGL